MLRKMLGGVGGGMITFLELANMVDATQDVGWGGGGGITLLWRRSAETLLNARKKVRWQVVWNIKMTRFSLIERIVTTIFNCFSPCKCDDIVSRSSNNANTHSSEHSMHIRTKHMSTKHHGHLHAVYLVHSLKLSASLDMKNRPRVQKKDHFLELPPNQ